jgi:hypothetical protein
MLFSLDKIETYYNRDPPLSSIQISLSFISIQCHGEHYSSITVENGRLEKSRYYGFLGTASWQYSELRLHIMI